MARARNNWTLDIKLRALRLWLSGKEAIEVIENLVDEFGNKQIRVCRSLHSTIQGIVRELTQEFRGPRRTHVVQKAKKALIPVFEAMVGTEHPIGKHALSGLRNMVLNPCQEAALKKTSRSRTLIALLTEAGLLIPAVRPSIDPCTGVPYRKLGCPLCQRPLSPRTVEALSQYSYYTWSDRRQRYVRSNRAQGHGIVHSTTLSCAPCGLRISFDPQKSGTERYKVRTKLHFSQERVWEFLDHLDAPISSQITQNAAASASRTAARKSPHTDLQHTRGA